MAQNKVVPKKEFWKSKTLWLNVFLFGLAVTDLLKDTSWIRLDLLVFVGATLNAVLRVWFSDSVLKLK